MSYRDVEHCCVSCGAPLISSYIDTVACERCPRCHGIWIEPLRFVELLRATPTAQRLEELMVHNDGSPRRPCPHCGELMDLGWIDFLQLDQCVEHGVWLDAGELDKALVSALPNPDLKALIEKVQRKPGR